MLPTADPGVKENALRTVQTATRAAEKAVVTAARLAAAAGLDYSAPAGFQVDLTGIERVRISHLQHAPSCMPDQGCSVKLGHSPAACRAEGALSCGLEDLCTVECGRDKRRSLPVCPLPSSAAACRGLQRSGAAGSPGEPEDGCTPAAAPADPGCRAAADAAGGCSDTAAATGRWSTGGGFWPVHVQ